MCIAAGSTTVSVAGQEYPEEVANTVGVSLCPARSGVGEPRTRRCLVRKRGEEGQDDMSRCA